MAFTIISIPSRRIKDQTGRRFGRLFVRGFIGQGSAAEALWWCSCDCGRDTVVSTGELNRKSDGRRSGVKSCGCLQPDVAAVTHTRHGCTRNGASAEYQAWLDMKARCSNQNAQEWDRYGARGIKVCDQWRHSFEAFIADVGPRPSPDHSIDRIDTNGNYEPGNCRWATRKEQQRNRRCTTFVVFDGERLPLAELAERVGISRHSLKGRMRKGIGIEAAVALGPSSASRSP